MKTKWTSVAHLVHPIWPPHLMIAVKALDLLNLSPNMYVYIFRHVFTYPNLITCLHFFHWLSPTHKVKNIKLHGLMRSSKIKVAGPVSWVEFHLMMMIRMGWILMGVITIISGWFWYRKKKQTMEKNSGGVPKGNLGWPFIGETLDFIACGYTSRPVSFMDKRKSL